LLYWLGFFFPLVSPPQMWGLLTCSAHHCQKIEDCFLLACSSCKGDTIEQCSFLLVPHFGECSLFVPVRKPLNLAICACDHPGSQQLDILCKSYAQFVPTCGHGSPFLCSSYLLRNTTSLENACTRIVQSETLAGIDHSKKVNYCKWQLALKNLNQAPKFPFFV
jgi:hypothetical protein